MSERYTIKVVARESNISKVTGEMPIRIRITKDGELFEETLFRIKPEYWDEPNKRVRKSHPNALDRNNQIQKTLAEYDSIAYKTIQATNEFGIAAIRDRIRNNVSFDYIKYVETQVQKLYDDGNTAMYKRDKCVIADFKSFIRKDSLPLNAFTPDIVKKFETYLITEKENQRNTITGKMKRLSKYAKNLFVDNNLDLRDFPFRSYKMQTEETEPIFLTERDFQKLVRYKAKCTPHNSLRDVLDLFLMECYTGIRISDLLTLKWKHYVKGRIVKRMEKTRDIISISVAEVELAEIIINARYNWGIVQDKKPDPEAYVFDILKFDLEKIPTGISKGKHAHKSHNEKSTATASINRDLKKLAKVVEIKKNLSTHVARHTFATRLIEKGVDLYTVSKLLGHKNLRTTQIYAHVLEKTKNKALRLLN